MADVLSKLDPAGEMLPNFNFVLRVDGMFDVPLKSVRAFTRENEYEYIQEGGLNDYVHIKRKPVSKPFTLVCELYIGSQLNDPLSNGTELTLPLMLYVGKNVGGKISVENAGRYYVFTGAVVMSKEYGQLDAERAGLLTETVTIGYNRMFCITNPSDETGKPQWQMNEGLAPDAEGNTQQLYSKSGKTPEQNKEKKRTFSQNSVKWEFSKDGSVGGNEEISANHRKEFETTKKKMIENSKLYNFGGDKVAGQEAGTEEAKKEDLISKARKFEFSSDGSMAGNKMLSAQKPSDTVGQNILEKRQDEMTKAASLWEFKDKEKSGNGATHVSKSADTLNRQTKEEFIEHSSKKRDFGGVDKPEKQQFKAKATEWQFAEGKDGEGTGSRNTTRIEEERKDALAGRAVSHVKRTIEDVEGFTGENPKAKKWEFKDYAKDGNGASSRNKDRITEKDKGTFEKKAVSHVKRTVQDIEGFTGVDSPPRKWEFNEKTKEGTGDSSRNRNEEKIIEKTKDVVANNAKQHVKRTIEDYGYTPVAGPEARQWEFNGKGVSSRTRKDEASKDDMISNANAPKPFDRVENPVKNEFSGKAAKHVKAENKNVKDNPKPRAPRKFGTVPNPVKDHFKSRAKQHVKQSITDFLMKK